MRTNTKFQNVNKYRFRNHLAMVSLLFTHYLLWAGSGKVAGKVTSQGTGDALPGVNVFLEETSQGSATDINGEYVILNVAPGTYTLKASYIGYTTVRVQDLRVSQNRTTKRDFILTPEVLEGQEVTVIADRPMIHKDLTASQKITTSEEIKDMPVESFLGVLTTHAGVNQGAGGEIHIRGGRYNEVGYYIDGVSVSNPFYTNALSVNISNKALEEMRVVSGAFNAEYGNAMSGIVNLQIKEGGPKYHGSISAYTGDYFSKDEELFTNIENINYQSNRVLDGTLNGPVPFFSRNGNFTFNITGRYSDQGGYLYGVREHLPDDLADFRFSDNWYIEMGGDSSYVSMNPSKSFNTLGKLTFRITPKIKISIQDIHNKREWKSYSHSYKYNPDGTYNYYSDNRNSSVKLNQAFGRAYYELNLFTSKTDYKQYVFENPYSSKYVSTSLIRGSPPTSSFVFGGTQMGHYYRESNSIGGKFDLTVQVTTKHEIKLGVSSRIDVLEEDNFIILYNDFDYPEPTVLPANESPSHNYYNKEAKFFSGYVQDKIEYPSMVINIGTRFDQFDPDDDYVVDLIDPEGDRAKAEPKKMVSPRLGISFPVTERGILHFSYGHFYQMPTLRRLYKQSIFGAGLSPTIGYADLKPEKTVLYEFGLQQQFTDVIAIDLSAYYKDIRDLLAFQSIRYESPNYGPSSYAIYLNKDYASVKGFTFSLTKRYDPRTKLSAFLDYAYQVTEGNSVSTGSFYFNSLTGEEEEKKIVPLSWDQRHVLNATVTWSVPDKWGISMIGKLSSGWPYTPNIPYANYVPDSNSDRKPWQKNVNARIFRNLNIGKFNVILFIKAYNLFDTRNERYVYNDTGRAGYTFVYRSSQETEALTKHYGTPGVHTWEEYHTRPHYYTAPREFQLGISLEF